MKRVARARFGRALLFMAGAGLLALAAWPVCAEGSRGLSGSQVASSTPGRLADGDALLAQRRYREAMEAFEAVLVSRPEDEAARKGEVQAAIALALEQTGQQRAYAALQTLEHANGLAPNDPELLLDLGIEATMLQQFTLAEDALQQSLKLRPEYPKTLYALARLATEQQRLPEAVEWFKKYLALRPADASAYFGLGHVYAMQQRNDDARGAFMRSVALQPKQTESYYQLGQLDLEAHQDAPAAEYFAKALERDPKHAGALTGMGELALRAKDYAKAEQYLAEAERSDPNYQTPHYFRGLALAKLGRKEEAEQEMRQGDSRPHVAKPGDAGMSGDTPVVPQPQPPGA